MRRREFMAALTGAAAWPFTVRAQQVKVPVIGLLNGVSFEGPYAAAVGAIRQGLQDAGLVEGQNLRIAYRSADGRYERLPDLVTELIRNETALVIAIGVSRRALAAQANGSTIPIVLATGSDDVEVGLARNLNRPEGDVSGMNFGGVGLAAKRLELLLELRPGAPLIGYLDNSGASETFERNMADIAKTARSRGRDLLVFEAATEQEIESAFTAMALQRVRALVVSSDPFLTTRQEQIIELAARSTVPAIYATRGPVMLGGLMSYGVLSNDTYRLAGIYAGRILNGEAPAEPSIMLPKRFELVINTRTARALRISVPRRLLSRADEIIG